MCKHTHTTEVTTILNGEIIVVNQCDMCGMTVPEKRTSVDDDPNFDINNLPCLDEPARDSALTQRIRAMMASPYTPAPKAWGDSINRFIANRDRTPIKAKDVEREPGGDALWA